MMSSRAEYLRHMVSLATRELIIEEARPPFWVNSSGLPSAYNGLDYSTMRLRLRYAVDTDVLGEDLADKWVPLSVVDDDEVCALITRHVRDPESSTVSSLYRCFSWLATLTICPCIYHYDVQAVLQRPRLFMLSEKQWRKLLSHSKLKLENSTSDVSCLDIGAGCGDLTVEFMNVFKANNVTATEVSKMMCRRLSQKGIRAVRTADPTLAEVSPTLKKFDAVFCLNVLDRCKSPKGLLNRIAELVAPGGTVVVAVPVPLAQLDALSSSSQDEQQALVLSCNASFEEAARCLWNEYLGPTGFFTLAAFTRCPYLCTGPIADPILPLDDAVFVLTRVSDSQS